MSQWIKSGVNTQSVYFDAPPALGAWVVYGSLNGAAAAVFTTPTIAELSLANMPGVYSLLLDEQFTITSGNPTDILKLYIKAGGWAGKSIEVVLFNNLPANIKQVNDIEVIGDGEDATPWNPV